MIFSLTPNTSHLRSLGRLNLVVGGVILGILPSVVRSREDPRTADAVDAQHQVDVISRRLPATPLSPMTVIDVEQARSEGVATTEDLLRRISANLPSTVTAQAVGGGFGGASYADLRGLGPGRTLVLLNGRRLANSPQSATAPDLNVIPFAALERVEVLRDGASAIYGADAVAGVINFITRDSYRGALVDLQVKKPRLPGGGGRQATLTVGVGDLADDHFNGLLVVDLQRNETLRSRDRPCCGSVVVPERGIDLGSSAADIANYSQTKSVILPNGNREQITYFGNPVWPSCRSTRGGRLYNPGDASGRCFVDTGPWEDIQPQVTRTSVMGQGTYRIDADHRLQVEAFIATSTILSEIGPVPLGRLSLAPGTRYFPGAGITPTPTNFVIDPNLAINLIWRVPEAGGRRNETRNLGHRAVLAYGGRLGHGSERWDYSVSLSEQMSRVSAYLSGGYTDLARMQLGLDAGIVNPFGAQDTEGSAFVSRAGITGKVWSTTDRTTVLEAHADRALPGVFGAGRAGHLRLTLETSQERLQNWNNQMLQSSLGVDGTSALSGDNATRRTLAGAIKLDTSLNPSLDVSLALRGDRFSDLGGSAAHTVAARWRPRPGLTLQGSLGQSFFVPSLLTMYGQQSLDTAPSAADDPLLCPNGVPAQGVDPSAACNQFFQILSGSNAALKAGRASTQTASMILEPARGIRLQADMWWTTEFKSMVSPSLQAILANADAYADRIHRLADGTIGYVDTRIGNVGRTRTHGVDLAADVQGMHGMGGVLGLRLQGTYVRRFEYQRGGLLSYEQNAGRFLDYTPIPRWQHTLTLTYTRPMWSGTVANRYTAGYWDENFVSPEFAQRVGRWSVFDASVTWRPNDAWNLTLGVANLLNAAPPFSNQTQAFQVGYDPRISDPVGRTLFLNLSWKFR